MDENSCEVEIWVALLDGYAHAAVGHDYCANDVAGLVRSQEGGDLRDFLGTRGAANGRLAAVFGQIGLAIGLDGVGDVGDGIARADRVYADAVGDGLQRQRAGQLRQRALGRGIGGNAGKALVAGVGANVDDGAGAGGHHRTHGGAGEQEGTGGIDRQHLVPFRQAHLGDRAIDDDAGVVD